MTRRETERGQALLTALLVLLLVSIAAGLLAAALLRHGRLVRQEATALELRALGDSALAEALAELALDRHFAGAGEHAFAGGTLTSEVAAAGANLWTVRAHARLGPRTRSVEAEVRRIDGRLRVVGWHRSGGEEP